MLSLYRLREQELQDALNNGDIEKATYDESLQNFQKQLLADTNSTASGSDESSGLVQDQRSRSLGFIICLIVPIISISMYLYLGGGSQSLAFRIPTVAEISDSPEKMLAMLEQAFDPETATASDWALLGRTYSANSKFDRALQAYTQAMQMEPDNISYLSDFIEVSMMQNNGKPVPGIKELITLGLSRGENVKLLWLAAVVASYENDVTTQQQYLQKLLQKLEADDPSRPRIQQILLQLSSNADDIEATNETSSTVQIHVKVELDARLEQYLNEESTLFVFAKAPQGPPMPIAVARYAWNSVPDVILLDDSKAMTPTRKLSQFDAVDVTAQISQTGQANARAGDLRGTVKGISTGESVDITILIDELIE